MLIIILAIAFAYLWGAFPTAYLAGKYLRGIDIRKYGSGNVGASNLTEHVGKKIGLSLGVFDCVVKGAVPVWAAKAAGLDIEYQVLVGLAAIIGHNWSVYIGFTGGRGVATGIGVLLGFGLYQEMVLETIVMLLLGRLLLKDTAFWTILALITLPPLAWYFDRPPAVVYMTAAIGLVLVAKRLTANWELPKDGYSLPSLLFYRLLWDRDVPKRQTWTRRAPATQEGATHVNGD
ncbi:MAG: hypothetical protein FJ319_02440 [SAR202 cluster bacterium]|nr:hypothetical protein [SAR202 cluster bacterium]